MGGTAFHLGSTEGCALAVFLAEVAWLINSSIQETTCFQMKVKIAYFKFSFLKGKYIHAVSKKSLSMNTSNLLLSH